MTIGGTTPCSVLTASLFGSSQHSILFEQAFIELYNNNNNKMFYYSNKHMYVAMQALKVLLGGAIYICYKEEEPLGSPRIDAPAYTALSIRQFLAERNIAALEHPPYSPDMAFCDLSPTSKQF